MCHLACFVIPLYFFYSVSRVANETRYFGSWWFQNFCLSFACLSRQCLTNLVLIKIRIEAALAGNFSKVSGEGIQDLSKMGVDKRGIKRGACIECGQCDDYETPKDGHDCDYYGCKPPKHPATDLGTHDRDDTTRTTVAKKIRLEESCFQQQSDDGVSTGACRFLVYVSVGDC